MSNANLFCSYNVTSSLFSKFGLVVKHKKSEVFHFSRLHRIFNSFPLDLIPLGGSVLHPKNTWHYLGFFFDQKLSFYQHINFYANKAILTVKCMKMLSNSTRGLNPLQKRHLYRSYILPITFYSSQLQYYNNIPLYYPLKSLRKIQQRVALYITGVFHTLPSIGVKAIAVLVPINLQLKKLNQRFHLQVWSLPPNHIIKLILSTNDPQEQVQYRLSIESLTSKQKLSL